MAKIAWTDATWNPVVGCTPVSAGCANCYARTMHRRLTAMGLPKYAHPFDHVRLDDAALNIPFRWRKPRRIFVNSMSDLFHAEVTNSFLEKVWATMLLCPHHQFQIVTKRPERIREYLASDGLYQRVLGAANKSRGFQSGLTKVGISDPVKFPASWIQLITSCENQETVEVRIPILLKCPAAVRGVSLEPLLGPVEIERFLRRGAICECDTCLPASQRCNIPNTPPSRRWLRCNAAMRFLDWVIVGCESGPKRRDCALEWIESIVEQCRSANVPLFVKQISLNTRVSHKPEEWPEHLRVRMWPGEKW